jgi:hypothetical protein
VITINLSIHAMQEPTYDRPYRIQHSIMLKCRYKLWIIIPLVLRVDLNYKSLFMVQKFHGGSLW